MHFLNFSRKKITFVTKGGTQKLPQKCKIVEIYEHDHSLAPSDGTISFSIQTFSGKK
jgi:hypothetical protein